MREIARILILLLLAVFLTMLTNIARKCNELEAEIRALHEIQSVQIEQAEKDIRLLKTDVDIIQHGYREEK